MADWRNLGSRFDYEVAIGTNAADRDSIIDTVRELGPKVRRICVDGQYVICSDQSHSIVSEMLLAGDTEMKEGQALKTSAGARHLIRKSEQNS